MLPVISGSVTETRRPLMKTGHKQAALSPSGARKETEMWKITAEKQCTIHPGPGRWADQFPTCRNRQSAKLRSDNHPVGVAPLAVEVVTVIRYQTCSQHSSCVKVTVP